MTYWVYILASRPGGAIYTGVTNNLSLRVWQHRHRQGGLHTKRYGIGTLVYYERYDDVRNAIQRERNMKHWPPAWKFNLILEINPTWRDLYEELNGAPLSDLDRGDRDKPGHDGGDDLGSQIGVAGTSPAMTPSLKTSPS